MTDMNGSTDRPGILGIISTRSDAPTRQLTVEDLQRVFEVVSGREPPRCPHETTPLHPRDARALDGVRCPCCGVTLRYP